LFCRKKPAAKKKQKDDDDDDIEIIDDEDEEEEVEEEHAEWWRSRVPDGADLEDVENAAKCMVLMDIIMHCQNRGERLVVFSSSLFALDMIEKILKNMHEQRQEMIKLVAKYCIAEDM
jgi:transcriptional regulator ATRX